MAIPLSVGIVPNQAARLAQGGSAPEMGEAVTLAKFLPQLKPHLPRDHTGKGMTKGEPVPLEKKSRV